MFEMNFSNRRHRDGSILPYKALTCHKDVSLKAVAFIPWALNKAFSFNPSALETLRSLNYDAARRILA